MSSQPIPVERLAEAILVDAPLVNPFIGLNQILSRWFYKPDLQAIRIVMGTLQAHYLMVGDPAWLFVVAPPGSGKTTVSIMGASGLPTVNVLGDLTENTFLSGFYGHKDPGLLEKLGETTTEGNTHTTIGNGVLLIKDFTTVLTMRRDRRAAILSQLREIHDGQFRRDFGTGVTKIWHGQVSIVAAVTPVLDMYYSIFNVLGERFLQIRWHRPDSPEAAEWAIRQQGHELMIRESCRKAVQPIFKAALTHKPILSKAMIQRLAKLAEIAAIGRTKVIRSSFGNREIEFVPEAESNTRIAKGLAAIALGIASLNQHEEVQEDDLQDAFRVGVECLPELRGTLMLAALRGDDLNAIGQRTNRERQIEELQALELFTERNLSEKCRGLFMESGLRM
jgi:hypothetical protein